MGDGFAEDEASYCDCYLGMVVENIENELSTLVLLAWCSAEDAEDLPVDVGGLSRSTFMEACSAGAAENVDSPPRAGSQSPGVSPAFARNFAVAISTSPIWSGCHGGRLRTPVKVLRMPAIPALATRWWLFRDGLVVRHRSGRHRGEAAHAY